MTDPQQLSDFLASEFPQSRCTLLSLGPRSATLKHAVTEADLRPGGTVSGPTLMALADVALYAAILGEIGIVPLAVTTSFSINFMRKPRADRDLIGECQLMKVGRSLAVGEVSLYSEGESEPVAHAVGTYAIPPQR
ncbi:PaaI family thioesterase [Aestuariirhabdus litorea]|uniref:PaaI family thioesterase n=1 Tax=Aestuariirhabdus litorea TaxID=2528527 RepID=A0A3P3VJW2_9GAMM|nr:PaaI family thioesterase [Aestuariirhabdus litorea]RRJ83015.1 PaaI family thioesterase [Aestuariirhabdus litorea]RWW93173.1 PaaI family thioesterase [Endozoicomonadaceae bacterium GTF-13]